MEKELQLGEVKILQEETMTEEEYKEYLEEDEWEYKELISKGVEVLNKEDFLNSTLKEDYWDYEDYLHKLKETYLEDDDDDDYEIYSEEDVHNEEDFYNSIFQGIYVDYEEFLQEKKKEEEFERELYGGEIDWDSFSKEEFIKNVKKLYSDADAVITQNGKELSANYNKTNWRKLFSRYETKDWLQTDQEKETWNNLPEELIVYRGSNNAHGLSWTLSKEVAEKFAFNRRYSWYYENSMTSLYAKKIKKTDIRALILDYHNEQEVILC